MSPPELEHRATPTAQQVLDTLGRTEDLQFSPCRRKMAIAAFENNQVAVFSIFVESGDTGPLISLSDPVLFASKHIDDPHGLAFIDENTLVVANRSRYVSIFRIPTAQDNSTVTEIKPLRVIRWIGWRKLHSPGSVEVYRSGSKQFRLLICDNYAHRVTSAQLSSRSKFRAARHRILFRKSLQVPDGVCVSDNHKWIAISNHVPGTVFIYANTSDLNPKSDPAAVLSGMDCPHGLCFWDHDRKIMVADSASPFVYVYSRDEDQWRGEFQPCGVYQVMDEATFELGHVNPEEGGTKGIDINSDAGVVATTSKHQPLRFFSLSSFTS